MSLQAMKRGKLDETASAIQGPHGKGKIDFVASRKKSSVKDLDKKTEVNGFLSSITHGANELASSVRGQIRKRRQESKRLAASSLDSNHSSSNVDT